MDRNNVTLLKSDGTDLSEISPHCSDNSHNVLDATLYVEYALDTTFNNNVRSVKGSIQTYLWNVLTWLFHRVDKMKQK